MDNDCVSPSFRSKIKSSICCFRKQPVQLEALEYNQPRTPRSPRSPRSPYAWLKCQSQERRNLLGRVCSAAATKSRKRYNSADLSYDPMSYSLNFEDDRIREDEPFSSFSLRLPTSPERSGEIIPYVR